jgi:RNA polymerase sigma-70 factor (ECF subfamily)
MPDPLADFRELATRWLPTIRRFAFVLVGRDPSAVEEVEQDVLIALLQKNNYRGDANFSTFLYSVVRYKALDFLRRRRREWRRYASLEEIHGGRERLTAGQSQATESPEASFLRREAGQQVLELVLELPENERAILFLREFEELSVEDCARILKLPQGTVKSGLHRIKKKLYLRYQETNDENTP